MHLNPYARFLAADDPMTVLPATPARLESLLSALDSAALDRSPAPGKWSLREIAAHLADCELVFGFRLRQALAVNHPHIQPFDQAEWAKRYAAYDTPSALALFRATRDWNVRLIQGTTPAERARPLTHPERGTMSFWTIVETMAGHDRNHLQQIEALTAPIRA